MLKILIKMSIIVLIICSILLINNSEDFNPVIVNEVDNTLLESSISNKTYEEEKVYKDLTLTELSLKLDKVLNSTLKDQGKTIASISLEYEIDPVVATSIILVETGCKWKCSYLARECNNVGGMRGKGCGSYQKFDNLEEGITAFARNLSKNYYQKGLTTPEAINKKYATNPNWYKDVYYYVNLIEAS